MTSHSVTQDDDDDITSISKSVTQDDDDDITSISKSVTHDDDDDITSVFKSVIQDDNGKINNHQNNASTLKDPIHVDDTSPDPQKWLEIVHDDGRFNLYSENKENILNATGWLCDSEVTAAQYIFKANFPHIDGLRDSAMIGPLVTPVESELVQVLNTGSHWLCISNVGATSSNEVQVYDSGEYGNTAKHLAVQHACRMLSSNKGSVKVIAQEVHVQSLIILVLN